MVCSLDSGSDSPGSSPGQGTASCSWPGKTLNSQSASFHPSV